jgi:alcohol/geraniol dehydrogenase (NADP+)
MTIHAHAAMAAKKPLEKFEYDPGPLGPDEVEVEITHCGICHSDVHLIDNDWQMSVYPLVPGHEIVGAVAGVGANVKHLKKGQRVGVGWQCGSCGHCEYCARGEENLCSAKPP